MKKKHFNVYDKRCLAMTCYCYPWKLLAQHKLRWLERNYCMYNCIQVMHAAKTYIHTYFISNTAVQSSTYNNAGKTARLQRHLQKDKHKINQTNNTTVRPNAIRRKSHYISDKSSSRDWSGNQCMPTTLYLYHSKKEHTSSQSCSAETCQVVVVSIIYYTH